MAYRYVTETQEQRRKRCHKNAMQPKKLYAQWSHNAIENMLISSQAKDIREFLSLEGSETRETSHA